MVFERDGVNVVVDKTSMQFVFGSEVDYVDGLQGAGFAVNNPNVVAACGCGSSFQVKDDAPSRDRLRLAAEPVRDSALTSLRRRASSGRDSGRRGRRGPWRHDPLDSGCRRSSG